MHIQTVGAERRTGDNVDIPVLMQRLSEVGNTARKLRKMIEQIFTEVEHTMLNMTDLAGMTMAEVEKRHIENTLRMFGSNRRCVAKALDISPRTLYRKLDEYGLR